MSARKRKRAIDAKQCAWARWWLGYEFGEAEDLSIYLDDEPTPYTPEFIRSLAQPAANNQGSGEE